MDPFTQGVLGAALPQAAAREKPLLRIAGGFGFIAGMAADLDVFIRSNSDPLLFLEYHRHFTHSLAFIPFGGLISALLLHAVFGRRWQVPFRQTLLFCVLGYATHALLDACTSYGTQLFWPFSDARVSWSTVSVIDPLFTLPLAGLILVAALRRNPLWARIGLAWAALYMAAGLVMRENAVAIGRELAVARGHVPLRLEAKPSFGNILVWKTIYETRDAFHVDAAHTGSGRAFAGTSIAKLDVARDFPWLDPQSQQAKDIERFRTFSQGFVALDPGHPNRIIDMRYSFLPYEIVPLWSIEISPEAATDAHVRYLTHREEVREKARQLWRMVTGAAR